MHQAQRTLGITLITNWLVHGVSFCSQNKFAISEVIVALTWDTDY